jgi:hypothetical protein
VPLRAQGLTSEEVSYRRGQPNLGGGTLIVKRLVAVCLKRRGSHEVLA